MIGPWRIEGFAIVSADGMIADETGVMPLALQRDSDKAWFEAALEPFSAVVHGRHSQEIQPKAALRPRLVVTGSVASVAPDPANPLARLWNPAGASLRQALEALGVAGGQVAAIGGPKVYSLFLDLGYDVFHLCRVGDVRVPGGLRLFARDRFDGDPEACLAGAGLTPGETVPLGDGVTLTDWTRG
ncbi:dihydrofolate reductase [Roseiarcus fermentans]|uniref:Dihydrofolate reductase n=1 Tax=Roseiarcus fermentans TaxID=1473586 RepID=A0A366ERM5_9HYPH|nr:dihydrofolate reductase [Roseiarcus fermentans]RBP05057.1 dihydrofolate reductase [Roseiarcus fermentans]